MLLIDMVLIFQAYKKSKAFIATQGEPRFFTGLTQCWNPAVKMFNTSLKFRSSRHSQIHNIQWKNAVAEKICRKDMLFFKKNWRV